MRPDMDTVLMDVAHVMSWRATCSRKKVGAIVARDTRVISSGYNGVPSGIEHCVHLDDESCRESVHAETNALLFAAQYGVPTAGASMYITIAPCYRCSAHMINAGITRVVYGADYRDDGAFDLLSEAGVTVVRRG